MNLKEFREKVEGTTVRLLPKPKYNDLPILDSRNVWLVIRTDEETAWAFQNTTTQHEVTLARDHIRDFRTPNDVILRGQLVLKENSKTAFESFAPGFSEGEETELIDKENWSDAKSKYAFLKPHESQLVTLGFPDKDGSKFGTDEVTLVECKPHFVTLRREELRVNITKHFIPGVSESAGQRVIVTPAKTRSISLEHLDLSRDEKHLRCITQDFT